MSIAFRIEFGCPSCGNLVRLAAEDTISTTADCPGGCTSQFTASGSLSQTSAPAAPAGPGEAELAEQAAARTAGRAAAEDERAKAVEREEYPTAPA